MRRFAPLALLLAASTAWAQADIKGTLRGYTGQARVVRGTERQVGVIPGGAFDSPVAWEPGWYRLVITLPDGTERVTPAWNTGGPPPVFEVRNGEIVVPGAVVEPPPVENAVTDEQLRAQFRIGTWVWGLSYYGAMTAPLDRVERDAAWAAAHAIGNVRIWPDFTKEAGESFRVWDRAGNPRPGQLAGLKARVAAFRRHGISTDLTLYCSAYDFTGGGGEAYDITPHRRVVERIVREWHGDPSVRLLDACNEGEARGPGGSGSPKYGHMSAGRFHEIMTSFGRINPDVLISYSVSGDLEDSILPEYEETFSRGTPHPQIIRPHAARPASPGRIDGDVAARLVREYPGVPVFADEPGRRYYLGFMPRLADFVAGATSTCESGAVGWEFHNGESFDLRTGDLSQRLDAEELKVMGWLKTHRCVGRRIVEVQP